MNAFEKTIFLNVINLLANTDEEKLFSNAKLTVNRNFYKINDTLKFEYIKFTPQKYNKVGLFFLGNGSNFLSIWQELSKITLDSERKIYILNYRGYGKSDEKPSFKTLFEDNQNFLNFIQKKEKIDFVIGYSLYTVSATYLASENNIEKLVLMAPFSNSKDMFTYMKHQKTKGWKFILRPLFKITADDHLLKISNIEKIKKYKGDLLILHGTADKSLPISMSKNIITNAASRSKKLITINSGDHGASFEQQSLKEITTFLKNNI